MEEIERNIEYTEGKITCTITINNDIVKISVSTLPVEEEIIIVNVSLERNKTMIELEREEKDLFYSKIQELYPDNTDAVFRAIIEPIHVDNVKTIGHFKSRYNNIEIEIERCRPEEVIELYNKMLKEYTKGLPTAKMFCSIS